MSEPVEVELLADGRLVVWSTEDSRSLFNTRFYGKPLGNPRPKEDFDELTFKKNLGLPGMRVCT